MAPVNPPAPVVPTDQSSEPITVLILEQVLDALHDGGGGFGIFLRTALGNFGLRLIHAQDAGLMVLVWQFGSVVLMTAMAGCAGKRVLRWRRPSLAGS